MKKIYFTFLIIAIMLQIEIVGLLMLDWGNVRVWNAQTRLNEAFIDHIQHQI